MRQAPTPVVEEQLAEFHVELTRLRSVIAELDEGNGGAEERPAELEETVTSAEPDVSVMVYVGRTASSPTSRTRTASGSWSPARDWRRPPRSPPRRRSGSDSATVTTPVPPRRRASCAAPTPPHLHSPAHRTALVPPTRQPPPNRLWSPPQARTGPRPPVRTQGAQPAPARMRPRTRPAAWLRHRPWIPEQSRSPP